MTNRRTHLRRTAALWGGAALALAILLHQGVRPLAPDTWLALGAGDLITRHGIPQGEPWTQWGIHAWIDQQWLGQWIIALVHGVLGHLGTLLVLGVLPTVIALAIAAHTAWRLGARPWAIGVTLPIAAAALAPFVMVRPQTLVFPLFALAVDVIIRGRVHPERLWLLLPVLILWANIHGTALPVAAFALCGVAWVRRTSASDRWDVALYAGIILSPVVSPLMTDLPAYYARMMGGAAALAVEWQPLNAMLDPALALLVVAAGYTLARRTAHTLPLALLATALAGATLMVVRFGPWLALAMCVLAPVAVRTPHGTWLRAHMPGIWRRLGDGTVALCLAALSVGALGAIAADLPSRADELAPDRAAADAVPSGAVLADLQTANWLMVTRPDLARHLLIDARLERYARPQLERAVQATQGLRAVTPDDAKTIVLGGRTGERAEYIRRMGGRVTPIYENSGISVLAVRR